MGRRGRRGERKREGRQKERREEGEHLLSLRERRKDCWILRSIYLPPTQRLLLQGQDLSTHTPFKKKTMFGCVSIFSSLFSTFFDSIPVLAGSFPACIIYQTCLALNTVFLLSQSRFCQKQAICVPLFQPFPIIPVTVWLIAAPHKLLKLSLNDEFLVALYSHFLH